LIHELMEEGYELAGVGDAKSVWSYFARSRPDLVLLDLFLEGFEGFDLLREIKRRDPDVAVLIVSAYDSFVEEARLAEADGYIIKNFVTFDELKEEIRRVLGGKVAPQAVDRGHSIPVC